MGKEKIVEEGHRGTAEIARGGVHATLKGDVPGQESEKVGGGKERRGRSESDLGNAKNGKFGRRPAGGKKQKV